MQAYGCATVTVQSCCIAGDTDAGSPVAAATAAQFVNATMLTGAQANDLRPNGTRSKPLSGILEVEPPPSPRT